MTDLRSIAFRSNRSRMLLKPRGRSSESLGEYTLSNDYEQEHRPRRRTEHEHVRLGGPILGNFYCRSFHGIYDAFLVA
jgi:hypothetical protein